MPTITAVSGEIDIIVADDKYIVFVEVKTRDEKSISTPLEAVTFSKKKKLIQNSFAVFAGTYRCSASSAKI